MHHRSDPVASKALNHILDKIFVERFGLGWTNEKLATEAGLHLNTVYRLAHRITERPQFRSVYRLARAVGRTLMLSGMMKVSKRKVA